ncbi:hypothetical protein RRG08_023871 [Elysia crispata]|uniref:Uncharacterized protein n=1 Tax=Elysia crispata TaxID=231223 RepID=A0AAE1AT79_9GAST|nr:hypothetical protein RRG08_023871 [Elysia crispata]
MSTTQGVINKSVNRSWQDLDSLESRSNREDEECDQLTDGINNLAWLGTQFELMILTPIAATGQLSQA